jgi:hypothetical protein
VETGVSGVAFASPSSVHSMLYLGMLGRPKGQPASNGWPLPIAESPILRRSGVSLPWPNPEDARRTRQDYDHWGASAGGHQPELVAVRVEELREPAPG